tara:strand:+ start:2453 stop:2992 length:540 start_codon:yes stop_codon:yes gene_type:complete
MACTVTLSGITYGCDDLGIGGIVELHLASKAAALTAITTKDDATRVISAASAVNSSELAEIQFHLKDGFSVFSEVKTVNPTGGFTTVPTISVELPKMDATKISALDQMSNGPKEMAAFVKTAAGTYHAVGLDHGIYVSTVDGNSGTGRAEKNRFQLTLTGEEDGLSYSMTESVYNDLTT